MNNSGLVSLQQARMGSVLDVGGTVTNSGQISEEDQDTADTMSIGRLINTASGSLTLVDNGNTINSLQNQGTISISGVGALFVGVAHVAANAQAGVTNAGNVYIYGSLTTNSYVQTTGQTAVDGSLTLAGRGIINFAGGSVFGNQGTITGSVVSNAAFNLGDQLMSVGQLAIGGAYTQGLHGSLTADIAGAGAGQYDQLNVSGHAQLNGLLTVNLLNGFVPQIGNTFDIMNFASESGTFSMVDGLPINSQEHFVLEYNSTDLSLDVVPGQLTRVDARPASWLSSTASEEKELSLTASSSGAPSSTPEPGSILLFGSGVLGLAGLLRLKRRI